MMTTYLEFVCAKLLGLPINSRGDGQSTWICPLCERPKFHTRPVKFGCKNRYSCWRCGDEVWGDEFDIVRHCKPHLTSTQVYDLLNEWKDAFEQGEDPTRDDIEVKLMKKSKDESNPGVNINIKMNADGDCNNDNSHTYISFSQGETGLDAANIKIKYVYKDPDLPTMQSADGYADNAFDELKVFINNLIGEGHNEALTICAEALRLCANYRLHPGALEEMCEFEIFRLSNDKEHMRECLDPECEARCCMLARGWTEDEITRWAKVEREKIMIEMKQLRKSKRKFATK